MNDVALSLPFDCFERYRMTGRIIDAIGPVVGDKRMEVLDVGGRSTPMKHFAEDIRLVAADIQEPPTFSYRESIPFLVDAYVRAAGGSLPFPDASFDLVTAHDTLEHVPRGTRESFLLDLLRVSRRFVVLNGPVYSPESDRAERRLARLWRIGLGWEGHPMHEHLEMGLPPADEIADLFEREGVHFVRIPNGNLATWLATMAIKHVAEVIPEGIEMHEQLDRHFNRFLADRDFGGTCYREAFIITKDPSDVRLLRSIEEGYRPLVEQEPAIPGIDGLEELVATVEGGSKVTREHLARLDEAMRELTARDDTIREHDKTIRARDAMIAERDAAISEREDEVNELRMRISELDELADERGKELGRITTGAGYRVISSLIDFVNRIAPWGTRRRSFLLTPARALGMLVRQGPLAFARHLLQVWVWIPRMWERALPDPDQMSQADRYESWLRMRVLSRKRLREMRRESRAFLYRPTISIVMPTFESDPRWLHDAIGSVRAQTYDQWELCIADDGSQRRETRETLASYARKDPRIKVAFRERNGGISVASNTALELATGEFVGLLDHDDELKPNALYEVVKVLNKQRDLDFIYTDEDKRDAEGKLFDPFFKPGWSPDYLLSANYITHFSVFRRELLERIGGWREGYDGSQDYDLILRAVDETDRIAHIPVPVYSWRLVPGSAADSPEAKPKAYRAAKRALADAVERRGLEAVIEDGFHWGHYRLRFPIAADPLVSIVIPTRDRIDLLRRCINSIRQRTDYGNIEIVIVDNQSSDPDTLAFLDSFEGKVVTEPGDYNVWRMLNGGASAAEGAYLVFLGNDAEILDRDWIPALLEHAQRPGVAAAGLRMLFPDGRVQHEGIVVGPDGGLARNAQNVNYFGIERATHNVAAVSAACMMVSAEDFRALGGFEEQFSIILGDVDLCLRAQEKGSVIVYTPYASIYHDEWRGRPRFSDSRRISDEELFRRRWPRYEDPYYNPNLDLDELFRIGVRP